MAEAIRRRSVLCASASGLHRLSYVEWGAPDNARVVVCVHGLTRCARDFDPLAQALADRYRVVCPDMPGRGFSDWLRDPAEYAIPTYVNDVVTLVARLDVEMVDWVGTSMGGLVGMALAAQPGAPVRRMVLNEAGPLVQAASLERIATYVGRAPRFASFAEAEAYVRTVSAPFGPHSDAEWRFLTEHVVRQQPDGGYAMHYDPQLALPFNAVRPHQDVELWGLWDAIACPTLVIRGELSDLLTRETIAEMRQRGPRARAVEFAGVGHAPTLMQAEQIALVRDFLLGGE
ncbi:MAG: alpha/beta hydrolase [Burkholderiales bacterium]|nr:alpha/beta hydrolase [Burkholderiales bacterium]